MSMNTRRGFLRGAGIFGTIVGGVAAGKMVVEKHYHETKVVEAPPTVKENIDHLAPETDRLLELQACNETKKEENLSFHTDGEERMRISSFGDIGISTTSSGDMNKVGLSVGKDNRLWVKVNDEWKRVAIES